MLGSGWVLFGGGCSFLFGGSVLLVSCCGLSLSIILGRWGLLARKLPQRTLKFWIGNGQRWQTVSARCWVPASGRDRACNTIQLLNRCWVSNGGIAALMPGNRIKNPLSSLSCSEA